VHRDAGRWRHGGGIHPSVLSKGEQRGWSGLSTIGFGASRQIFGDAKDFCPNFSKLHCKVFVQLLSTNSLSQRSLRPFWYDLQKDLHVFFCKPWAPFFEVKQCWAPFLCGFSGMLPRFSANHNFWGCDCTPFTFTSNITAFHKSIVGNFVVYQDPLEI